MSLKQVIVCWTEPEFMFHEQLFIKLGKTMKNLFSEQQMEDGFKRHIFLIDHFVVQFAHKPRDKTSNTSVKVL